MKYILLNIMIAKQCSLLKSIVSEIVTMHPISNTFLRLFYYPVFQRLENYSICFSVYLCHTVIKYKTDYLIPSE